MSDKKSEKHRGGLLESSSSSLLPPPSNLPPLPAAAANNLAAASEETVKKEPLDRSAAGLVGGRYSPPRYSPGELGNHAPYAQGWKLLSCSHCQELCQQAC